MQIPPDDVAAQLGIWDSLLFWPKTRNWAVYLLVGRSARCLCHIFYFIFFINNVNKILGLSRPRKRPVTGCVAHDPVSSVFHQKTSQNLRERCGERERAERNASVNSEKFGGNRSEGSAMEALVGDELRSEEHGHQVQRQEG